MWSAQLKSWTPRQFTRWRTLVLGGSLLLLGAFSSRLPVPEGMKRVAEATLLVLLVHAVEREFFWKDIGGMVQEQMVEVSAKFNDLVQSATSCGLDLVYSNRKKADQDVWQAVGEARDRIWLLGIAFHEGLNLERLRAQLKRKLSDNARFDLRIMVLDSLRSPAVFRSLLESAAQTRTNIVSFHRPAGVTVDPLFTQPLHAHISQAFHHCNDEQLKDRVRFYGHDPLCWLVIADNTAFYEPYTFGTPKNRDGHCLGPCFPVFRFKQGSTDDPFYILEDHFKKLWATSPVRFFHFGLRLANSQSLTARMFERRGEWLKKVARGLASLEMQESESESPDRAAAAAAVEKRREARLSSRTDLILEPGTTLVLQLPAGASQWRAELVDVSEGGVALKLIDPPPRFWEGMQVSISPQGQCGDLINRLIDHFSARTHQLVVNRWKDDLLALKRVPLKTV
jgi:hypothetical protein